MKQLLLINPPVYDFAAYDLWARPLGLLYIAAILKAAGACVDLIDCMARPSSDASRSGAYGCGHYSYEEVRKPHVLKSVPKRYKRYGIPASLFKEKLKNTPKPDAVLVSSGMTYWYPGVFEAIESVNEAFPGIPVILGGVYASLCPEHARDNSGAGSIVPGSNIRGLFSALADAGINLPIDRAPGSFYGFPAPDYSFYAPQDAVALRTTLGCPFSCTYCAVHTLTDSCWEKKPSKVVANEILAFSRRGVKDIAFYDDALFAEAGMHVIPLLAEINSENIRVRFHTPNGLHARYINEPLARLLKESGFVIPRLSLETSSPAKQKNTGDKVNNEHFIRACTYLKEAGYKPGEYGAYIMMGMPGQSFSEVEEAIKFAHGAGAKALLAEYSPIPGTQDWDGIKDKLPSHDPLWHNNSLFPLYPISDWPKFQELKDIAHRLNHCFT